MIGLLLMSALIAVIVVASFIHSYREARRAFAREETEQALLPQQKTTTVDAFETTEMQSFR